MWRDPSIEAKIPHQHNFKQLYNWHVTGDKATSSHNPKN